jgi:L-fucose isomerase-like protein
MSVKDKKSKKQRDKATLASVTKEMAGPRMAESARKKEEGANHGVMTHDHFTYSERNRS